MTRSGFRRVEPSVDLPALDRRILERWADTDAFRESINRRPPDKEYTFYDGPPFATGSPHYGNLLAGVIKDVVPRYWTMRGYRVERRFGWDTHGLPIEMEVEKQLGISGPRQIRDYGVHDFNEACRTMVNVTTEEWEDITRRIGRWVDFDDAYQTMDLEFMETVWWVFAALWKKGLIYRDFKVMPYSWGAATTLSNFEVNLGGYRDVDDPSITVRLRVLSGPGPVAADDFLVIWTTTPWTLPGNLAVAVGENIDYVAVEVEGDRYWVAEALVGAVWEDNPNAVAHAKGGELLGTNYEPPFDYFGEERDRGAFQVISSPDVTTDEGTGLVHMAPAYGEADFYALQAAGLDVLVDPVDMEARFTDDVPEVAGVHVKDADATLIRLLSERGSLVKSERIVHAYPFCYRTDTPLIYKAIPTWFVNVESFRDRMVELNRQIHWVPESVGANRFGNWLEGARDWAISRNRFWGSCIPVWECETCGHLECIDSIATLEDKSGVRLDDLHKHIVDPVTYPCPQCDGGDGAVGTMERVPEVLDCWFESGSMPYAQLHYPFENKERFDRKFPAEFIAEGLDQTRGWFYTLHVLSTALFDDMAFRNCIVNGMILAADGRKMSKRLKNYPEPREILDKFGGDAVRAYLINSPVLRAEPVRFSEAGVRDVVRTVILPLWNAYSFFTTYAEADGITLDDLAGAPAVEQRTEMDRWILSLLQSLTAQTNTLMEGYYLYAVVGPVLGFVDDLTNWYIRRSRRRFWRSREGNEADKLAAFATLYEVLSTFSTLLAPLLPFITEEIYQGLMQDESVSVHHMDYPLADPELIDSDLESSMAVVRQVVALGRSLRSQQSVGIRQPLASMTVLTRDEAVATAVESHATIIADELNVKAVTTTPDESELVELWAKANFKILGPRFGSDVKSVAAAIAALESVQIESFVDSGTITVAGHRLDSQDIVVGRSPRPGVVVVSQDSLSVALDMDLTDDLRSEGIARDVVSKIQQVRRSLDLDVSDRIAVRWHTPDEAMAAAIERHQDLIAGEVLATKMSRGTQPRGTVCQIGDSDLTVEINKSD